MKLFNQAKTRGNFSKKLIYASLLSGMTFSFMSISHADTTLPSASPALMKEGSLYLSLEGGASFSMDAKMGVASLWDPSPQGYDNNLGSSEVLGLGVGYIITPALQTQVTLTRRSSYKYEQFQTSTAPLGNKTRYFDLTNTSIMTDFYLNGGGLSDRLALRTNKLYISPFINVGAGVAFNEMENFHSQQSSTQRIFSVMNNYRQAAFAYDAGAGLDINTYNKFSLTLAYRYMNGGDFSSNDYLLDNPDNPGAPGGVAVPAWRGKLRANEVYAALNYTLN